MHGDQPHIISVGNRVSECAWMNIDT